MDKSAQRAASLEEAILEWDQAVEAVLQDVKRVTNGGGVDEANSLLLRNEVERARKSCETLAQRACPEG